VPNAGFLEDVVFGHPSLLSPPSHDSDLTEAACETSIDQQNNTKIDEAEGSLDVNELPSDSSHALTTPNNDEITADEITAGVVDLKLPDNDFPNEPNDQHTLSTSDVDLLLDKCLLQALHTTLKDKDLPIPGSTLW
jgi:translation initiation factor 2D